MTGNSPSTADSSADARGAGLRWAFYLLATSIVAAVVLGHLWKVRPLLSANDRSRWCTVWSLVERGTYQIDEIVERRGWDTIDKVRHEGRFYSSKPPLLPTLVAGVYWCVKKTTGLLGANRGNGWNLLKNTEQTSRVILIIVNLLPMIAVLVVTAMLLERYAATDFARFFVFAVAAVGTLLLPFHMTLNNHTVAAASVMFALYAAARIFVDDAKRPMLFLSCGFFAGFACTNELPAAACAAAFFLALLVKNPKATIAYFVPASLVPLVAFLATNYLATGGWKPFYAYYGTETYEYVIDGVPSYWMRPRGLDNNVEHPAVYLLHCTFGHHGIFSLSPVFLLTLWSWLTLRRSRGHRLWTFVALGLVLTVVILGFYLSRTSNYNYGGVSAGLRWTLWLVPFWLVGMIPVLETYGRRAWFQTTSAVLLLVSVFSACDALDNPWRHPWLYSWMEYRGWIDYKDRPEPFDRPLTTWFSQLPEAADAREYWIELAGVDVDGSTIRLRLEAGREEIDGQTLVKMRAVWNPVGDRRRESTYYIDRESFDEGRPPEQVLRWPTGRIDTQRRKEAERFLRGLPAARAYRPGFTTYVKTPLRRDAFQCKHAASRVLVKPPGSRDALWYRTDVWLSPEVPFGIVRVVTTVSNDRTAAVVSRRSLIVDKASGF